MTIRGIALYGTLSVLAIASTVGCSSTYDINDVSFDNVRRNPTPELTTTTESWEDVKVALALMEDQNWRMFWGDLGRAWNVDHPSRLTPFPVPYRTGRPR